MKKGESFTLPANARNPMILTGRPQALTVTVGGKPIAPLGAPDRTISDVPVSAAALLARAAPVSPVAPAAAPAAQTPPVRPVTGSIAPAVPAAAPAPTAPSAVE
jgi:hypothetical protein